MISMRRQLILLILSCVGLVSFLILPVRADNIDVSVTVNSPECGDELDNDSDLYIDFPDDPSCDSSGDDDESDTTPECSDTLDNDGDSQIDSPADSDCDSALDDQEAGGGNNSDNIPAHITFTGVAYVGGLLNVLRNGTLVSENSLTNGTFSVLLDVPQGAYTFTLIAFDASGRSKALSFTLELSSNSSTEVSDIIFSPFDSSEPLPTDQPGKVCPPKADLNNDCRVNLIDFSIAAFWWGKTPTPEFMKAEIQMLNGDGVVNIYDFSILAYYWNA